MYNRVLRKGRNSGQMRRQGAAAVEFAVVAPLFLLLIAGIVEFGQAFRIEHMLNNASRRCARSAIVAGSTFSQVEQNAKTHLQESLRVKEEDITFEIFVNECATNDLSQAEKGDEIAVTLSIDFSKAGSGFFASMFSSSTLSSTCILEHE